MSTEVVKLRVTARHPADNAHAPDESSPDARNT